MAAALLPLATSSSSVVSGLATHALQVQEASETELRPQEKYSACFPLDIFGCCPSPIRAIIPTTFSKIQDWTHLSLIFGVFASIAIIVETISQFYRIMFPGGGNDVDLQKQWPSLLKEILFFVFIAPLLCYFLKIIGQYDARLRNKQAECQVQKAQLTDAYNGALSDMDGCLKRVAESSALLAERSFESKRRDFQRFLERAKSRYAELAGKPDFDGAALLTNFRAFVLNWLKVFEECSIDPMNHPKRILKEEELNACPNIAAVCDLVLPRLRCTEVRFITVQREQDTQILKKSRNEYRRLTAGADPKALASLESGGSGSFNTSSRELITDLPPSGGNARRCSWLSCGSFGCGLESSMSSDGYPKHLLCGCCRLTRLSREHTRLMVGFIAGILIFAADVFHAHVDDKFDHRVGLLIEVSLVELCIVILLARFEEIDQVQKLEREIKDLRLAEQNVKEMRQKMHEFWSSAQHTTELWLYRTVPRLDLYKEVHSLLEDAPPKDLNDWMSKGNTCLQSMEKNLGELSNWRNEGTLTLETKKAFGKKINGLCQEQEFEKITKGIDSVIANDMKALKALEAPTVVRY